MAKRRRWSIGRHLSLSLCVGVVWSTVWSLVPMAASAQQVQGAQAQGAVVTVSAAASLGDAMREVAQRFERQHTGVRVRLNVAASGVLVQQMAQGAPVDVLVSADAATMDRAQRERLVDASTRRVIAGNALVLAVPNAPAHTGVVPVRSLNDLGTPQVRRVAIGKPATVPAGLHAREALEAAGLWATVAPRIVPADSVRQVLDYLARGEVDAGFVYRTDAAAQPARVRVVQVLPTARPVMYPAAVAQQAPQPALAREFLRFLLSEPAQAVLRDRGFAPAVP